MEVRAAQERQTADQIVPCSSITAREPASTVTEFADGRAMVTVFRPAPGGGFVTTVEDITEQRRAEKRIAHIAHHDSLTGLHNRAAFSDYLATTIDETVRAGGTFAILCLDLDKAEKLRGQRMAPAHLAQIARQAQAFGDPTRLDLAVSLQLAGELCVCDLAWISGRSQNLVSHHLRALKAAELADSRREGKVVFYRLTTVGDRFLSEALVATLREMVEEVEVL